MVLPKFLKPVTDKVGGFLAPVADSTTPAAEGSQPAVAVRAAVSKAASDSGSLGLWALIAGGLAAAWYFFIHKRTDKRHKHRY